ncbi:hypothetical protein FN846DRAFT_1012058 [Sphaerosporella brunnea]|uniref:Uncharacterized protein n=1 Tax=Sphaerosporella brunnea TaxID=1250544 RepID=A0A5J5EZX7_9PEZI|nr:hypothetical protein FN846DRAFT_1012058 [Sphaerosporella brunnea]
MPPSASSIAAAPTPAERRFSAASPGSPLPVTPARPNLKFNIERLSPDELSSPLAPSICRTPLPLRATVTSTHHAIDKPAPPKTPAAKTPVKGPVKTTIPAPPAAAEQMYTAMTPSAKQADDLLEVPETPPEVHTCPARLESGDEMKRESSPEL